MERRVGISIVTIMLATGIAPNCSRLTNETPAESLIVVETPAPKPVGEKISVLSTDELAALKKFAESYQPKSGREVIPSPPVPNESISRIIAKAANSNAREHEKFVALIFLRISRFQIENFNQRYELGRINPLTKEFYRLTGRNDFEMREMNSASLADDHVETSPELPKYELIDVEMQRIAKAGERIMNDSNK